MLQRGQVGVGIFLVVWIAALIVMLDGVTVVSYRMHPFSSLEERIIKLDVSRIGFQFWLGVAALVSLSAMTFFVQFYEECEANTGLRVLFGTLPLLLMAFVAYCMLPR